MKKCIGAFTPNCKVCTNIELSDVKSLPTSHLNAYMIPWHCYVFSHDWFLNKVQNKIKKI